MNNFELSILTLLHYNVVIRDTLEYALSRGNYSVEAYNYKKRGVMVEIKEKTTLQQFLDNNEEKIGKKVRDEINDLYATVYADDSTIVKVSGQEVRVDDGQHIAIFDVVFPLHDDVCKIIQSHVNFGRSKNMISEGLVKLIHADNKMYQAVAFQCLYRDLEKLFVEYNKARNEAKGELTPQSNFIQGELLKIVKHVNFVKENMVIQDLDYWDIVDMVVRTVDQTGGRRALPSGKSFKDIFEEGRKMLGEFVAKCENEWKGLYEPAIQELVNVSKKNNGQISVNNVNN